jgi:hypothetical protein
MTYEKGIEERCQWSFSSSYLGETQGDGAKMSSCNENYCKRSMNEYLASNFNGKLKYNTELAL